jgi:hypothetical protein
MTRTRAWATAAIVTISLVGLVLLIGASTGNLGFHGNTADADLESTGGSVPLDAGAVSSTTSFTEAQPVSGGEGSWFAEGDDQEGGDHESHHDSGHEDAEHDDHHEGGEDD